MLLDRCTEEFKQIFNRYRKHRLEKRPEAFNVMKILEQRNRQLIDKTDEEDLLYEEAMGGMIKLEGGSDDKAIHHRNKMQKNPFEKEKKKFQKKSLLNILDHVEIDPVDHQLLRIDTMKSINTPATFISSMHVSPNISPKFKLQYINISTSFFNINDSHHSNKDNIQKIQEIIETNPTAKKHLTKVYNDRIQLETKRGLPLIPSKTRNLNDQSFIIVQTSTTNNTKEGLNRSKNYSDVTSRVNDEYMKMIKQVACKEETSKLLKVIDKQNRLKNYVGSIEKIEDRLNKAKINSTVALERYEKKKYHLKSKYKRVLEKNFSSFS